MVLDTGYLLPGWLFYWCAFLFYAVVFVIDEWNVRWTDCLGSTVLDRFWSERLPNRPLLFNTKATTANQSHTKQRAVDGWLHHRIQAFSGVYITCHRTAVREPQVWAAAQPLTAGFVLG